MADIASKWNVRYQYSKKSDADSKPATVLLSGTGFLPEAGVALDLACGRGANALWMAKRGLDVHAWDISDVAIAALAAESHGMTLRTAVRDVVLNPPEANLFDVIVVSRFLDRALCPSIENALKPGGTLFYQTFSKGLSNTDFLLKAGELPTLFPKLNVLWFDDPVASECDESVESSLIARRSDT